MQKLATFLVTVIRWLTFFATSENMKSCNQCGKCCIKYADGGLSATQSEIDWWELHRPEIFEHVKDGKIWVSPENGEPLVRCPWLVELEGENKYACQIYHDRPDDCRHYPTHIDEMIADGCEMLQDQDLIHPIDAQK